jgi:excisionase family DNA binding protein
MHTNLSVVPKESRQTKRAARPEGRPALRPETGTGPLWLVRDVAAYLNVSSHAIYRLTATKAGLRMPHVRLGRHLRFRQADVDRWLQLLTVSNLEALARMRQHAAEVTHGHHQQAHAP